VSSTPIAVNDATADVAIWLMLGALRNINQSFQAVRQGQWIMFSSERCID
jgi:glyoxylate reductase